MDKRKEILQYIRMDPFISQQELSKRVGLSRPAVANYIANLIKSGEIRGRAYVLKETSAIVCIGGVNIDRKAKSEQDVRLYTSNPVETQETCGGVARNFAENLSHLGCSTILMACVGEDKAGEWLLTETKNAGIDVSQVWQFPARGTGTFTTLLDVSGRSVVSMSDMTIYENLTVSMIEEKWAAISTARAVFLDTNLPVDCVHYIINRCYQENIPMYIDPVSSAKALKLPERLDGLGLLILDQEEAEALSGKSIDSMTDCENACQQLRQRGVKRVIVILDDGSVYYYTDEEAGHLSPIHTEVADDTGITDALGACVIYGILNGESLHRSCQLGLAGMALTSQTEASISDFLSLEKLYEMVVNLDQSE
ncbi:carbohydrate kinase [Lentibacillus salicampi]|uniref:Winged helix-turn-helix transcriptional regulator n=1 Tax=Lentibacillus salicampi TaxID=175306 RepID=A0A4Y9ADK3_9BACI|nr:carbohydrate kinase [Lentibacillus salicampi]TFJ93187.1 winged helix-turn-helix transcriptional regulator [Lentibacillus salicampi]